MRTSLLFLRGSSFPSSAAISFRDDLESDSCFSTAPLSSSASPSRASSCPIVSSRASFRAPFASSSLMVSYTDLASSSRSFSSASDLPIADSMSRRRTSSLLTQSASTRLRTDSPWDSAYSATLPGRSLF